MSSSVFHTLDSEPTFFFLDLHRIVCFGGRWRFSIFDRIFGMLRRVLREYMPFGFVFHDHTDFVRGRIGMRNRHFDQEERGEFIETFLILLRLSKKVTKKNFE